MGQIVIDIPTNAKRRYKLNRKDQVEALLSVLDLAAIRVKNSRQSHEDLEYSEDVRDIEKALAEFRRTGKTYAWESVKAEVGL